MKINNEWEHFFVKVIPVVLIWLICCMHIYSVTKKGCKQNTSKDNLKTSKSSTYTHSHPLTPEINKATF